MIIVRGELAGAADCANPGDVTNTADTAPTRNSFFSHADEPAARINWMRRSREENEGMHAS
jgi:hypothetical protein